MAQHRTAVSPAVKRQLVQEAGGKCANPGCANYRTHLHHIHEWAVYATHDGEHMIALCPSCHDAVHYGPLVIDDDTIYRWKGIKRDAQAQRDHVYVEPAGPPKLLLGTLAVTGNEGVVVFQLGQSNTLSFRIEDEDLLLLNVGVTDTAGRELLRVTDNHVRQILPEAITYERVPGHVRVAAKRAPEIVPTWAVDRLREFEPNYGADETVVVLDLEVLEPGLVGVQGIWVTGDDRVVIVTKRALSFLSPWRPLPISLVGEGVESLLNYEGPLTTALFNVEGGSSTEGVPAALNIPSGYRKVGRNEPCPCGSGEKYKRCHGR
jgi:SEC-C motif-containing protein/HNH endonuclease